MPAPADIHAFVNKLLSNVLQQHRAEQVFLFGPDAEPFWVARRPISTREYDLLGEAIDLLNEVEQQRPRPFIETERGRGFVVAAFGDDSDLYLVLIEAPAAPLAVAAGAPIPLPPLRDRIAQIRDDIAPKLEHVRTAELRIAAGLPA